MTDSMLGLKLTMLAIAVAFLALAIALWMKTPQLFEYFNQAFCAH